MSVKNDASCGVERILYDGVEQITFLLTYLEADLSLWFSIFGFRIWYGGFHPMLIALLTWLFGLGNEPRLVHWCLLVRWCET